MNPEEEIRQLEDIIDRILAGLQETMQSGEILSDDFQLMIAQELNEATQRIDQLRREISEQESEEPPPVEMPLGADLLWILAGGQEEAFINYLRTVPDPAMQGLIRNPNQLNQVIDQLSTKYPQGINLKADGIQHAPLMSSNVYGYRYDPRSQTLLVRFNSGSIYRYQGVPRGIYNVFASGAVPAKTTGSNRYGQWWVGKTPSLGASFYEMIRSGPYPYEKVK